MTDREVARLAALELAAKYKKQGKNYREIAELVDRSPAWVYYHFGPTMKHADETRGRKTKNKQALVNHILNDRAKGVKVRDTCFALGISLSYYHYLRQITLGKRARLGRPRKEETYADTKGTPAVGSDQGASDQLPAGPDVGETVRDEGPGGDT